MLSPASCPSQSFHGIPKHCHQLEAKCADAGACVWPFIEITLAHQHWAGLSLKWLLSSFNPESFQSLPHLHRKILCQLWGTREFGQITIVWVVCYWNVEHRKGTRAFLLSVGSFSYFGLVIHLGLVCPAWLGLRKKGRVTRPKHTPSPLTLLLVAAFSGS